MKKFASRSIRLKLSLVFSCLIFLGTLILFPSDDPASLTEDREPYTNTLTFREAKLLAKEIYRDHRFTFYCHCKYDKHNKVDLKSCGYKIQNDKKRAERLEWEHIMPVSLWGCNRACWKGALCVNKKGKAYGGRGCCEKIDKEFIKIEADLHNLVPEIGELNALRSNYRFGILPHIQKQQFGACCFKIDEETRRVEPRVEVRGMVARVYLYMSKIHHIHLSDSQRQLFEAWNRQYPPDDWEIERDKRIAQIQGNHNPYILEYSN